MWSRRHRSDLAERHLDLVVPGAQKSGTSALATWLGQHPDVRFQRGAELSSLLDVGPTFDFENALEQHYAAPPHPRVLAAKCAGLMFHRDAIERLAAHAPRCRLVVALRNPVERAWSAYWFARLRGWESAKTFEGALEASPSRFRSTRHRHLCAYLERGEYVWQVEALHEAFGAKRVLVVLHEELERDALEVCRRAFAHAGVDPDFRPRTDVRVRNAARARSRLVARAIAGDSLVKRVTGRALGARLRGRLRETAHALNATPLDKPPMCPATRERLLAHFEPANRRLSELLGRSLAQWSA